MNKNLLFGLIIGLVVGAFAGFFGANQINRNAAQSVSPAQMNAQPPNQQLPNVLVKEQPPIGGGGSNGGMLPDVSATIDKANNAPNDFDAQIKAGDLYQQIQGFEKAAQFYERAHQIKPDDYALIVKLGNIFFDAKQFEKAAEWYEKALAKKPDDANVRTDFGVTFVERANPDFDRAVKEFETSLKSNPKNEPTLYNLGAAYAKKGSKEDANRVLAQLETVNPNSQLVARLRQVIQ